MKTQLLLNVKLVSLTILFVVYNNPIEAQINCESFKQIKTGNEIATSYSNWVGGKADLWGNSFLDIFVTGPNEIILASLQPESLYLEKYDAQLNLLKSKSLVIVMNKARSYYGMTQVGEQLYIIYTEKISTGSLAKTTRLYAQRIDNNTLELTEEKIDMLGSDDDIEIERNVPGALFAPKSKVYLGFSENHKYISILLYPQTKDDFAAASFIYKVFNPDLSIAYEGNISTPYKLIDLRSLETGISNDGEFALGIGIEKNRYA